MTAPCPIRRLPDTRVLEASLGWKSLQGALVLVAPRGEGTVKGRTGQLGYSPLRVSLRPSDGVRSGAQTLSPHMSAPAPICLMAMATPSLREMFSHSPGTEGTPRGMETSTTLHQVRGSR